MLLSTVKVQRFQSVPRNPDRGEQRKVYCRERHGHICKLSQRMSKCRQKAGRQRALLGICILYFDAVLTFVASYCAWIVARRRTSDRSLTSHQSTGAGKDDFHLRGSPACRMARTWRIMRRIQTRDLRSKKGVVLLCGAVVCFPVISQGETSNDRGNQDNS